MLLMDLCRIPPRTCLTPKLIEAFGDVAKVRPIRDRQVLVTYDGTLWGTGAFARQRIMCTRDKWTSNSRATTGKRLHPDGPILKAFYGKSEYSYTDLLNDTIFCPQPAGIAGMYWTLTLLRTPSDLSYRLVPSHSGIHLFWMYSRAYWNILSLPILQHYRLGTNFCPGGFL